MFRIGQGFDVHLLVEDRPLILAGVEIPWEKGLLGHSDADVLLHAVADAVLGAIGEGDIGRHFPDSDEAYRGMNSGVLLQNVWLMAREKGYHLGNLDVTVIAERPKLAPYILRMRQNVCAILGEVAEELVNIKATTTEKLGFTGRGEGIAALAVVLLLSDS